VNASGVYRNLPYREKGQLRYTLMPDASIAAHRSPRRLPDRLRPRPGWHEPMPQRYREWLER